LRPNSVADAWTSQSLAGLIGEPAAGLAASWTIASLAILPHRRRLWARQEADA
jgi:hypothetical protein